MMPTLEERVAKLEQEVGRLVEAALGNNTETTVPAPGPVTPPLVNSDPGVGTGLWAPPGTTDRIVADPSGPATNRIVSYIPGCLNGGAANNSAVGCAANNSYMGRLAGAPHTVRLVSGKQLLLRYRPKPNAGTTVKGISVSSATGGTVGARTKVWLSPDPTATYDSVPAACRDVSTTLPSITTGPGPNHCPISPDAPVYYLGIETSSPAPIRFKVQESQSDLY